MARRLKCLVFVLVAGAYCTAPAQTLRYGAWQVSVGTQSDSVDARTANESGSVFGYLCLAKVDKCIFYVTTQTTCTPNSIGKILINSDAGVLTSLVTCTKLGENYYNVIHDTINVSGVLSAGNSIGIAMPLQDGLFRVVHFSLSGARDAIKSAQQQTANLAMDVDHTM